MSPTPKASHFCAYTSPIKKVAGGLWLFSMLGGISAQAGTKDDVGWVRLQNELGVGMPTGAGVGVLHVEYFYPAQGSYAAQAHNPEFTSFVGVGSYAGKTFTLYSQSTGSASLHADGVAQQWYQLTPGLSPGVTDVGAMEANDFINRVVAGTLDNFSTAPVQNHSWIILAGDPVKEQNSNILNRQYDKYLESVGAVACVGIDNAPGLNFIGIPAALAPAYHVIAVGKSDGFHKSGGTPLSMDGAGRMKPDLVSISTPPAFQPYQATSWSTGVVSGVMTLLYEGMAAQFPGTTGADRSRALKAMAIAGADKSKFPRWQRTATARPYDGVYGAGEVDVYRSWKILSAGQQGPGAISGSGWKTMSPPNATPTQSYTFSVPDGKFANLSCALTWHRRFQGPNPVLDNYNLTLSRTSAPAGVVDQSNSVVDNVEYLHQYHLPAGSYSIEVSGLTTSSPYALAWHLENGPGPTLICRRQNGNGPLELRADRLDPWQIYTIESSTTLAPGGWSNFTPIQTALDSTPAFGKTVPVPAGPDTRFFRLRWSQP